MPSSPKRGMRAAGWVALSACLTRQSRAAPIKDLLVNGDFKTGLDHWAVTCTHPRCATAAPDGTPVRSPGSAAALRALEDDWSGVQLRQELQTHIPSGTLRVSAYFRTGPGSWANPNAAVDYGLAVEFDDGVNGSFLGKCREDRTEMPAGRWEPLKLQCTPPAGARRAFVVISFAAVRGVATLLVDDVSAQEAEGKEATDEGEGWPSALRAELPRAMVPRVLHFIFGLSADFGGKPFGMVHYLVIRAALHHVTEKSATSDARTEGATAYFHYAHEPTGPWWEKARELVVVRKVAPPTRHMHMHMHRHRHRHRHRHM